MKLVDQWRTVAGTEDTCQNYNDIQHVVEARADAFFQDMKESIIPSSLQRCIEEKRTNFGIETTSWYLNTNAFVTFRTWLAANSLVCTLSQLNARSVEQPDADIVLLFAPAA